jgi:hypothetical protein
LDVLARFGVGKLGDVEVQRPANKCLPSRVAAFLVGAGASRGSYLHRLRASGAVQSALTSAVPALIGRRYHYGLLGVP